MMGGMGMGSGMGLAMVVGFVLVLLIGLALFALLLAATVWLVRDLGRRSPTREQETRREVTPPP